MEVARPLSSLLEDGGQYLERQISKKGSSVLRHKE